MRRGTGRDAHRDGKPPHCFPVLLTSQARHHCRLCPFRSDCLPVSIGLSARFVDDVPPRLCAPRLPRLRFASRQKGGVPSASSAEHRPIDVPWDSTGDQLKAGRHGERFAGFVELSTCFCHGVRPHGRGGLKRARLEKRRFYDLTKIKEEPLGQLLGSAQQGRSAAAGESAREVLQGRNPDAGSSMPDMIARDGAARQVASAEVPRRGRVAGAWQGRITHRRR